MAPGILTAAQAPSVGVPCQSAVIGFESHYSAVHLVSPLTTGRVDAEMLGEEAARALIARFERSGRGGADQ